jgi:transposase InsO family protein
MGQVLHGCATTTEAVRRAIQNSQESLRDLAKRYGINQKTGRTSAAAFLEALIAAVPYKIHTVLTDNGIQFTFPPRYAHGPTARYVTHMFDVRCQENGIEHRLTKKHPWTNGRVERMNRTIKEATVQRYHYDRHD